MSPEDWVKNKKENDAAEPSAGSSDPRGEEKDMSSAPCQSAEEREPELSDGMDSARRAGRNSTRYSRKTSAVGNCFFPMARAPFRTKSSRPYSALIPATTRLVSRNGVLRRIIYRVLKS